ncbi:hypothetical protein EDB85DRAFT_1886450 [Lactarius pseudohatsudake]|nr:hypothetical protein EDB85DRAFT_1886450 [Lactarius pseudohatsudake]
MQVLMEYRIGAKRKWDSEGQGRAKRAQFRRVRVRLLPDKTTSGSNAESVLWKQVSSFYFWPGSSDTSQRDAVAYSAMGSAARLTSSNSDACSGYQGTADFSFPSGIGRSGTGLIALALNPFLTTPTALATALHAVAVVVGLVAGLRAEDALWELLQGWIAPGWRVWSVGEDLLSACQCWGTWVGWQET